MNERAIQIRVGALVLFAGILTVVLVFWFGNLPSAWPTDYTVHMKFSEAPGVRIGTPVRTSGVLIGRVTAVELHDDGVEVTAAMNGGYHPDKSEVVVIRPASLLGDTELEFSLEGRARSGDKINPGDYIGEANTKVRSDPMADFVDLTEDMSRAAKNVADVSDQISRVSVQFEVAAKEVGDLAKKANRVMDKNDGRLEDIFKKADIALSNFNRAMDSINEVAGDPETKARLKKALNDLPDVISEAKEVLVVLDGLGTEAKGRLSELKGLTTALGESGPDLMRDARDSLARLDELMAQLVLFSQALNSENSTIGMIMRDRALYDRVDRILTNVEEVSWQIKPVVSDLRAFSSKIARDPGRLGVKGALDRSKTGLKEAPLSPMDRAMFDSPLRRGDVMVQGPPPGVMHGAIEYDGPPVIIDSEPPGDTHLLPAPRAARTLDWRPTR